MNQMGRYPANFWMRYLLMIGMLQSLHQMIHNLWTFTSCRLQDLHLYIRNIPWKFTSRNATQIKQCSNIHLQIFIRNIQWQIFTTIIHSSSNIPSKSKYTVEVYIRNIQEEFYVPGSFICSSVGSFDGLLITSVCTALFSSCFLCEVSLELTGVGTGCFPL